MLNKPILVNVMYFFFVPHYSWMHHVMFLDSAGMVGSMAPLELPRQVSGWHPARVITVAVAIGSRGSHDFSSSAMGQMSQMGHVSWLFQKIWLAARRNKIP